MLYLKCEGQVVKIVEDERLADKYINANTVHFEFCERWDGMVITAQFTQKRIVLNPETQKQEEETKTFNVLVDEITNTVTMPNEIEAGKVDISAFGAHPETGVRITTIPVTKTVDKSGFVGDGDTPIPPTPDLYAQLIAKVEEVGQSVEANIGEAVQNYLTENPVETGATEEQAKQIKENKQAIEDIVSGKTSPKNVPWANVINKPETYPPASHAHPEYLGKNETAANAKQLNGKSADQYMLKTDTAADSGKLGGVDASVYADFKTMKTHNVTVNTDVTSIANIEASSVAGILRVGGYFCHANAYGGNGTDVVIATIPGVTVKGIAYGALIDREKGNVFEVVLAMISGVATVKMTGTWLTIEAGTWTNFSLVTMIEG